MGPQGGDYTTARLAPIRDYACVRAAIPPARPASWSDSPRVQGRTAMVGGEAAHTCVHILCRIRRGGSQTGYRLRVIIAAIRHAAVSAVTSHGGAVRARARYHIQCRHQLSHHRRNRGSHGNRLGGALWCVKLKDSLLAFPNCDPIHSGDACTHACTCALSRVRISISAHARARCPITPT